MTGVSYALWRRSPGVRTGTVAIEGSRGIDLERRHIFPSGRQALTEVIKRLTGGRVSRVSIPEWSSHCVISAVGRIAMPIPQREVLAGDHAVSAILVYDQYGWPKSQGSLSELSKRLGAAVIHDCVDSLVGPSERLPEGVSHRIWSFSKTLGFSNGGAVIDQDGFVEFSNDIDDMDQENGAAMAHSVDPIEREFAKTWLGYRDRQLLSAIDDGTLPSLISYEITSRKILLEIFLKSSLVEDLPDWMVLAARNGIAPNVIPFFCSTGQYQKQQSLISLLQERYGLEARLYHFDMSDDALCPSYHPAIVLPIHGEVDTAVFSDAIAFLEKSH